MVSLPRQLQARQAPLQIFRLQRPSYPCIKKENKRDLAFAVFLLCFCLSVLFSFLLSLGCFFLSLLAARARVRALLRLKLALLPDARAVALLEVRPGLRDADLLLLLRDTKATIVAILGLLGGAQVPLLGLGVLELQQTGLLELLGRRLLKLCRGLLGHLCRGHQHHALGGRGRGSDRLLGGLGRGRGRGRLLGL